VLAVVQVTLALVLMAASGLMVRSFLNLRAVEHGFDPSGVLTLRVPVSAADYPSPPQVATFYDDVLERIRTIPGVVSAGAGAGLPYAEAGTLLGTSLEDFPIPPGEHIPNYSTQLVFPGFFESLDIPLLAGRLFSHADLVEPTRVVIVSRALADRFWPGQDPVGRRLTPASPDDGNGWYEIVGVVGSVRYEGLALPPTEVVYYPFKPLRFAADAEPIFPLDLTIVVETSVAPASLARVVTSAVWAVNPRLPVVAVRTMDDVVRRAGARPAFSMLLIVIAASMALVLGVVGLYGVMSSLVSQRTREMGIRLALGATSGDVTSMVLRSGMLLAGTGIALGIAASLALARLVRSFLFEVSPSDPVTFAAVAAGLAAVAMLASYVPAWRAARVDPLQVLRTE
jgi:predicted permease